VLVMYAGKVVEYASAEDIFERPEHPYTWGLLSSMPRLDRERADRLMPIRGTPPSLINLPTGCAFHPRCPYAELNGGRSTEEVPPLREAALAHLVACHLPASERRRLWASEIKPSLNGSARAREP
jgi:peptide/nickel transport system ATP-binding protein